MKTVRQTDTSRERRLLPTSVGHAQNPVTVVGRRVREIRSVRTETRVSAKRQDARPVRDGIVEKPKDVCKYEYTRRWCTSKVRCVTDGGGSGSKGGRFAFYSYVAGEFLSVSDVHGGRRL